MFKLPKLKYDYTALEPYIDAKTMEIHHSKHHAGYVKKLNGVLEKEEKYKDLSLKDLLVNIKRLPENIREGVRSNGGGHFNHQLFWEILSPEGGKPESELKTAIERDFGSMIEFKEKFSAAALGVFGSGWVWLSVGQKKLWICTTTNQDNCLMKGVVGCGCNRKGEGQPILGLDVWEHAYYLKYQNRRDEYVKNWWQVVNWKQVEKNYGEAL